MNTYYIVNYTNMEGRKDEQTFYDLEKAKDFAQRVGGKKIVKVTEEEILL